MNDVTSELRWILLASGAVLLLVIVIVGRWRRGQAADNRSDNAQRPSSRVVPRLDQEVTSARAQPLEPRLHIVAEQAFSSDDDLPDVRLDASADERANEHANESIQASVDTSVTVLNDNFIKTPVAAYTDDALAQPSVRSAARKKPAGRKIISLRLAAGEKRFDGAQLKSKFFDEQLRHGKYAVYHRLDRHGLPIFSVASMIEPGTFDLATMTDAQFPGVTFFMQMPGEQDSVSAYDQMLGCARNLQEALGGVVQDERGATLTPQRAERIREEIIDFQHLFGADASSTTATPDSTDNARVS